MIAKRSRQTPRVANRLLKRVRDVAEINYNGLMGKETATETFDLLGVDNLGLEAGDRKILEAMIHKFGGGPVGLGTLAAATAEETVTIEEIYEPFLMRQGFIQRTSRGRVVTDLCYEYLNIIKN